MDFLFGADIPLAVRYLFAALVIAVAIGIPFTLWSVGRARIRWLVIRIAEVLAIVVILLSTILGGLSGAFWAAVRSSLLGGPDGVYLFIGFVIGALSGLILSAITLAFLFVLIDISENTRKTATFFERLAAREQA